MKEKWLYQKARQSDVPAIVYPLSFDRWWDFEPWLEKFTDTFKEYSPGTDYLVYAVCIQGEPTDRIRERFYGIRTQFVPYRGAGCDIGAAQHVAEILPGQTPVIAFTSRVQFHREGWLKRYLEASEEIPGVYFMSASREGGKLHGCTRGYMMEASIWRSYPHAIDRRNRGPFFELGEGCLYEWAREQGLKTKVIHWDSAVDVHNFESVDNRFRHGNQEQMLVWDGHSISYANAEPDEKARLEAKCRGE